MREITKERLRAAWRNARKTQLERRIESAVPEESPHAVASAPTTESVLLLGGPRHGTYVAVSAAQLAVGMRMGDGLLGYVLDEMHVGRRIAFPYYFDRRAKVQAIRHWWRRPE